MMSMNYNKSPLVSVVIPSMNQGRFIEQTIQSVLNQDYPNVELIVIDGGSTDETLEILTTYQASLTWVSEHDNGQSHAINKGWRRSNGTILTWLNSDDYYEPKAISAIVNAFIDSPCSAVVYGNLQYVDADGTVLRPAIVESELFPWVYLSNVVGQPNAFIARWCLEEVGLIDESLHYVMDYDLWLRILGAGHKFTYIPNAIANARIHETTKTFGQSGQHLDETVSFMERYFCSAPDSAQPFKRVSLGYWYAANGSYWSNLGQYRRAVARYRRAVSYDRRYLRNHGIRMAFLWALVGDRWSTRVRRIVTQHQDRMIQESGIPENPFRTLIDVSSLPQAMFQ